VLDRVTTPAALGLELHRPTVTAMAVQTLLDPSRASRTRTSP